MKFSLVLVAMCFVASVMNLFCHGGPELPADQIALGRQLFFDSILSSTGQVSCATCHKPEFAFADTGSVSKGVFGRLGVRNTPSAMNLNSAAFFFWDGRAATLAEQALGPISNPAEMNLPIDSAVARLTSNNYYQAAFRKVYKTAPCAANIGSALAAFQESMETADTPFDDWKVNQQENAVSESAKRGFVLFNGSAKCVRCHFGTDFSNTEFRNIGLYNGKDLRDSGRAGITQKPEDLGKFKIGPLRNVALTAPYMHNGMFRTLRAVIDYYDAPDKFVGNSINRDDLLAKPLNLSEQDKVDLENFLRSLTSKSLVVTND